MLAVSFVTLRWTLMSAVWEQWHCPYVDCTWGTLEEQMAEASTRAGFDLTAPLWAQGAEFLATRLSYPLVAGYLVFGAVIVLAFRWRDRTAKPEY